MKKILLSIAVLAASFTACKKEVAENKLKDDVSSGLQSVSIVPRVGEVSEKLSKTQADTPYKITTAEAFAAGIPETVQTLTINIDGADDDEFIWTIDGSGGTAASTLAFPANAGKRVLKATTTAAAETSNSSYCQFFNITEMNDATETFSFGLNTGPEVLKWLITENSTNASGIYFTSLNANAGGTGPIPYAVYRGSETLDVIDEDNNDFSGDLANNFDVYMKTSHGRIYGYFYYDDAASGAYYAKVTLTSSTIDNIFDVAGTGNGTPLINQTEDDVDKDINDGGNVVQNESNVSEKLKLSDNTKHAIFYCSNEYMTAEENMDYSVEFYDSNDYYVKTVTGTIPVTPGRSTFYKYKITDAGVSVAETTTATLEFDAIEEVDGSTTDITKK